MAMKHTAAHFTCYHYYTIVVSSWSSGQGCICLPTSIEQKIKQTFPGNGVYVDFKDKEG